MVPDPDRLREVMKPDWSPQRARMVLAAMERSQVRRTRRRVAVGVLATAAVALLAVRMTDLFVGTDAQSDTTMAQPIAQAQGEPSAFTPSVTPPAGLNFRDGTHVLPHDADSEVMIASAGPRETHVELRRGGARFDVTPDPRRKFRVDAGLVTVEVLGTEFDCKRVGDHVTVEVLRGRVAVSWPGGSRVLGRGDVGVFPPDDEPSPIPDEDDSETSGAPADPERPSTDSKRLPRDAEALLREADQARKVGDTKTALSILRRVVREHGKDSRAPLAAFTIGKIELERKKYGTAARFFAKVRRMGNTPLAEHALAREAEAWAAAGNRGRATARAREYLRLHPRGPRVAEVRSLLESTSGD